MPTTTPTPIALVTGLRDDLRAAGIDALRAMTVNGPLLALSGNPETLVADLAAAADAACTVIELDEIDEVGAILDTVEPYLANERFVLLGIVTMLDARHFWTDFSGGEPDEVQQLIAQIEAASLVLLTGEAAMPAETLHRVEGFVRNLNPTAVVLPGASLAAQTLDTLAAAIDAAGSEESVDVDPDDEAIAGETDAWGFNSFTWTTESLLDGVAFLSLFEEWPSEILRAHGVVRMDDGGIVMVSAIRDLVTLDEYDELDEDDRQELGAEESELAFVGIDLPVSELVARLEACQIENV